MGDRILGAWIVARSRLVVGKVALPRCGHDCQCGKEREERRTVGDHHMKGEKLRPRGISSSP